MLLVVEELANTNVVAWPFADPSKVAHGRSRESALEQQELFLREHLAELPGDQLGRFDPHSDARLHRVEVEVPIPGFDEFNGRSAASQRLQFPVLLVPDSQGLWAVVLSLLDGPHVLWVPEPTDEDTKREPTRDRGAHIDARISDEIGRVLSARDIDGASYLRLLRGADPFSLERITVDLDRDERSAPETRAAQRRKRAQEHSKAESRKLLGSIGTSMLEEARRRRMPPVLHREREIGALDALLRGPERLALMLVGPELAGKTAVLQGLVQRWLGLPKHEQAELPEIVVTSGAQLVAGQSGFGQLERRIHDVMAAAETLDAVLYFDNLGDLFARTSGELGDVAASIHPWIERGRVRIVGELTPELLEHHEKRHVGFFAYLDRVSVRELDLEQSAAILRARAEHDRRVEPDRPTLSTGVGPGSRDAVAPLVDLAQRYLSYQAFPGKALRFYLSLRATQEGQLDDEGRPRPIGPEDVYRGFAIHSGIPMFLLREDRKLEHGRIVEFFGERVIGQREAIARVAETLCTVKAGLASAAKPLATFLFVGPTGVGKTEVAKTLARFLFGSPERMTRFDMSEYMDPLAADRLIRGTDRDDGVLTRKVRQQPFCVLLLDEIEKAHPAVFDLLLQVCGEGRLSDARGRTTWFHNAIIIMTSNLGAAHRRPQSGFGGVREQGEETRAAERYYLGQVDAHFRPEFVNRIDRVIPFQALDRAQIQAVAEVSLAALRGREGLSERGINLEVADDTLARLARQGYSDAYGARALRRELEDRLVAPLALTLAKLGDRAHTGVVAVREDQKLDDPSSSVGKPARAPKGRRRLASERHAGLTIDVSVPTGRSAKRTLDALSQVSLLRRSARAALELPPIRALRERRRNLVAELGFGAHERRDSRSRWAHASELGRLKAELGRIAGTVDALVDLLESIESAEELTIAALYEGEPADLFCGVARDAHRDLRLQIVDALLLANERHTISVRMHEHDRRGAFLTYLLPLIDNLEARRWTASFHIAGDRPGPDDTDKSTKNWPASRPLGPPRSPAWVRRALLADVDPKFAANDPAARGGRSLLGKRKWRDLVMCVRGRHAGAILSAQIGLLRIDSRWVHDAKRGPKTTEGRPAYMSLSLVSDESTLDDEAWTRVPQTPEQLGNRPDAVPRRVHFQDDGTVGGSITGTPLEIEPADYWLRMEEVLFGPLVEPAFRDQEEED